MEIRSVGAGDEKAVAELYNSSFSHWIETLGKPYNYCNLDEDDVLQWSTLDDCIESRVFVATIGQPVGFAHCIVKYEKGIETVPTLYFELTDYDRGQSRIGVLPDHRRNGVGLELVRYALDYKWTVTPKVAIGLAYSDNMPGRMLFERAGFQQHDVFYYPPFSDKQPFANSSIYAERDLRIPFPESIEVPGLLIRDATIEDTESVQKIHDANVWWNPESHTREWVKSFLQGKFGHTVIVAELDSQVVGEMDFFMESGIIGIAGVLPEYKRRGIGSVLLLGLLNKMKQKGIERALLDSGLTQSDAIRLYRRFGFIFPRKQEAWIRVL